MLTEQLRQPAKKEYTDLLHVDAAIRLGELGPKAKPALGDLAKALGHASPLVRGQALLALARIGPEAKPALPRLTDFYNDRKQPADLRQGAARALQAIDPDTAKKWGGPLSLGSDHEALESAGGRVGRRRESVFIGHLTNQRKGNDMAKITFSKRLSALLLGIWLVIFGLQQTKWVTLSFSYADVLMGLLAIVAGILIILDR